MRWLLCLPFIVGCASLDQHATLVQFRDPRAVELRTVAPDGTRARLTAGGERDVAAGGGVFRVSSDSTRSGFSVGLSREADGTSVLRWATGLSLSSGNEYELVRPDGTLPTMPGMPASTVRPFAADPANFHSFVCVAPGPTSYRGHATGYLLTARGAGVDTTSPADCNMGIAVELVTPWANVLSVRDQVDSVAPLLSVVWLVTGLPLLISGVALIGESDTEVPGVLLTVLGGIIAAAAIPGLFHMSHTDTIYPAEAL